MENTLEVDDIKKNKVLSPKCINDGERFPSYSCSGWLTPCCWVDGYWAEKEFPQFFDKELKLDNVDDIDEILLSEVWIDFFKVLTETPEKAPNTCWRYCGVFNSTVEKAEEIKKDLNISPDSVWDQKCAHGVRIKVLSDK